VASVAVEGNETVITIRDRGLAFMPTLVKVTTASGSTLDREVPVSHWLTGAVTAELRIPLSEGDVVSVEIDFEGKFPDLNRENNRWKRG
jgi:hypothetical protein